MEQLHLEGYICSDSDGIIALREDEIGDGISWGSRYGYSIIESIESFADKYGMTGIHHKGLGGRRAILDECNLRIYFTNTKCDLEEAMESLDALLYGGDIHTKVTKVGYSEFTITGLNLDEFTIGGHDLESELNSHFGEYCHFIIEC